MNKERGLPESVEDYKKAEGITAEDEKHRKDELFLTLKTEADLFEKFAREELIRPVTEKERMAHDEKLDKSSDMSGIDGIKENPIIDADHLKQIEGLNEKNTELISRCLMASNCAEISPELTDEYKSLVSRFREDIEKAKVSKPVKFEDLIDVYDRAIEEVNNFLEKF